MMDQTHVSCCGLRTVSDAQTEWKACIHGICVQLVASFLGAQDTDMADTGTDERRRLARQTSTSAAESTREHWARQLMRPEWMIDIPHDLASDWCGFSAKTSS